ncbi:MAG TPA: enoyl-CoA hydratase/isomerase family protein [Vulgatibacter sp.]
MPNEILQKTREGRVLVLAFNRPESRNALTPALGDELALALDEAKRDDSVRAVVLTGTGGSFCSGIDLSDLMGMLAGDPTPEKRRALTRKALAGQLHAAIRSLWNLPKPTVAAVEGSAAGFGLDLACACDLRVVARDARLSYSFTRRGLVPDGGTGHYLPRLVGMGRALELVLLGEPFDGERAMDIGLANRVVDAGSVQAQALELATRLAANAPLAMAAAKARLKENATYADELSEVIELAAVGVGSADALEGIAAFLEKRAPNFRGE